MNSNNIQNTESEYKQKGLENLILLVLGAKDREISLLHLEKEVFLLWNFHPKIKPFLNFIKHYKGPFSREIEETIKNPLYLENCWVYISPKKGDKLSGGYIRLTDEGKRKYRELVKKISQYDEFIHLLAGIKIVRELYDKLTSEELLLLIYDTYPEYIEKSKVYKDIKIKKELIAKNLLKKGFIDEERYKAIILR